MFSINTLARLQTSQMKQSKANQQRQWKKRTNPKRRERVSNTHSSMEYVEWIGFDAVGWCMDLNLLCNCPIHRNTIQIVPSCEYINERQQLLFMEISDNFVRTNYTHTHFSGDPLIEWKLLVSKWKTIALFIWSLTNTDVHTHRKGTHTHARQRFEYTDSGGRRRRRRGIEVVSCRNT